MSVHFEINAVIVIILGLVAQWLAFGLERRLFPPQLFTRVKIAFLGVMAMLIVFIILNMLVVWNHLVAFLVLIYMIGFLVTNGFYFLFGRKAPVDLPPRIPGDLDPEDVAQALAILEIFIVEEELVTPENLAYMREVLPLADYRRFLVKASKLMAEAKGLSAESSSPETSL